MASAQDIVRHWEYDPDGVEFLVEPVRRTIDVVDYDPAWPALFDALAARIHSALGAAAIDVEHVGSTSVPGLAAKPVIDIDVTVADPADEPSYRPSIEAAGFVLILRERAWHEHRLFQPVDRSANVHLFGPDCPEAIRHRLLRDWLRDHPDDRDRYAEAKRSASGAVNAAGGGTGADYNQRKEPFLRDLLDQVFRGHGLTGE